MADYHSLLDRTVTGMADQSMEARQRVYANARHALLRQLGEQRGRFSEGEIDRECKSLDEAIACVEISFGSDLAGVPPDIGVDMARTVDVSGENVGTAAAPRSALARAALRGVLWLVLQSLGGRTIGVLSQLALAWILDPSSFGLIGIIYALTTISSALVNFGVEDVLLQRERTIRFWAAPAFWSSLGLSSLGCAVTIGSASVGAAFYGTSGIMGLAICAGLMLPLGALQTVPAVMLRVDMNFRAISIFNIGEMAAVQVGTVALALTGAGAYSFVVPGPVVAAIKIVLLWAYARPPALKRCRPKQLAYMLGSGTTVFLTRLIISAISQGDYLILGLIASRVEVGIYYFAFKLAAQPLWILAANFNSVLFPVLIKLKLDRDRQVAAAAATARLLSYAIMPLCGLQAAIAGPSLHLMFGSKWTGAVPVVQVLSLGLAFDSVTWITGSLLSANREYRRALVYTASFAPLFFMLVLAGAWAGAAKGAACGVAAFYFVMGPSMCWLVFHHYGVRAGAVGDLFAMPTALAAASIGTLAWATSEQSDLVRIVALTIASPVIYIGLMALLVPLMLEELLRRLLPRRLQRLVDGSLTLWTSVTRAISSRLA
ncbi:lipopolysaccharide biosynthesis protein [Lichenibacterium minor]|uniref:Lipopolysaccharide biosynthesis protein n=1 Tax=Lichenibacterium minor TaxID=2316528 RepID=A0A4Q2TZB4_9HYPH|nr:oligosaccharide flippase family protein [Lichenibacterium minor]RYC29459.1 lipopolysaccharide biosynthesis protein [Lichenibacterium minor]